MNMNSRTNVATTHNTPLNENHYVYTLLLTFCTFSLKTLSSVFVIVLLFLEPVEWLQFEPSISKAAAQEGKKTFRQPRNDVRPVENTPFQGIISDEPHSALIGQSVLAAGGSAADAAVAMAFTLSVTLPSTASLGGGGMCLTHHSLSGRTDVLEFSAPPPTTRSERISRLAAAPATLRGMIALHERYGRANWQRLIEPAEKLARFGVPVSRALAIDLKLAAPTFFMDPQARFIFSRTDGTPLEAGDMLQQFDLAHVLTRVRVHGIGDFYAGQIATALIRGAENNGGSLKHVDLQNTAATWKEPISMQIGDFLVFTSPPPTAGALTAMQIWSMFADNSGHLAPNQIERAHLFVESSIRAFSVRSMALFSDGSTTMPINKLTSREYLTILMSSYNPNKKTTENQLTVQPQERHENPSATSFVVADKDGLAIACLLSLHNLFGLGRIAGDTGIVLAAAPNQNGLGPQSLSPILVLNRSSRELRMIATATGGTAAPSALAWVTQKIFLENLTLDNSINMPRLHHGGIPDQVLFEPGTPEEWLTGLKRRGHKVSQVGTIGRINAFHCEMGLEVGSRCHQSSDPRGEGMALRID